MATNGITDILVVEDDPNDAELTLGALEQSGFISRVRHVSDGREALDYIGSTGVYARDKSAPLPKLILLDLNLHKVGGLQVLREIKSDVRTRGIPIVVLTSSAIAIERVESYKLGVNSYVIKPTDAKKFTKVVADIGHYWLTVNEPPPL
jgi:two-component system response regulator